MRAASANTPVGVLAFDEKGTLTKCHFYPKDAKKALEEFLKAAPESCSEARAAMRQVSVEECHFSSEKEFITFISDFCALLAMKRLHGAVGKDKLLTEASKALDELTDVENTVNMRLREWFSLHYPEEKSRGKELAQKIEKYGARESFPDFSPSSGVALEEEDVAILKEYASLAQKTSSARDAIERYVKGIAEEIMPTTCTIVNPSLASRLMAHAGSLEKFSRMTASSIQLLGAEKALFRHLRHEGKSPKYGIIFSDSRIQNAPAEKRGRIARIISAKLMMAAKIDFFSHRKEASLSEIVKKELEKV